MKNLRQIIFFLVVTVTLVVSFKLESQNVYSGLEIHYNPCEGACSSNNISYGDSEDMNDPAYYISDFGPRDLSSIGRAAYDWHQGGDISPATS